MLVWCAMHDAPDPYQAPPSAPQGPGTGVDNGSLAQLRLLGELHESGVLIDDEFERQKQRILGGELHEADGRLGAGAHRRRRCKASYM